LTSVAPAPVSAGVQVLNPSQIPDLSGTYQRLGGNTIALLGDSQVAANALQTSAPGSTYKLGTGFFTWLNTFLRQRFHLVNVSGFSGQTTAYMLANMGAALASRPRYLFLLGGINDVLQGSSAAAIIANFQAIYSQARQSGASVIHATMLPANPAGWTATMQHTLDTVNQWIMSQGPQTPAVIVVPWHLAVIDFTTGQPLANAMQSDNVHPNTYGAMLLGQFAAGELQSLIPDFGAGLVAANTEYTNVAPNPMMNGTGGFLNFVGNAGIASGYFLNTNGSQAVTPSKVARTDGAGFWQQLQITAGAPAWDIAGSNIVSFQNYLANPLPVSGGAVNQGDLVYGQFEYQADADFANCALFDARLSDAAPTVSARALQGIGATDEHHLGGTSGVVRTPALIVPSTQLHFEVFLSGLLAGTTATIRLGRMSVVKVASADGLP
jgi:lysophospholipase L1-like esterase